MASTNKTPNYNLSQFIATDKPAWLTDVNGDMSKIDTAIKGVSDRVGVNETAITEAEANIEDNTTNITALQASSSQHGTDITDLKAQDIIIKNDVTNLGTRVTALENNTNYDLLWTNNDPTADKGAFTLNIDISAYRFLLVIFKTQATSSYVVSQIVEKGYPNTMLAFTGARFVARDILSLTNNSIEFSSGFRYDTYAGGSTSSTAVCLPIKIYGIK